MSTWAASGSMSRTILPRYISVSHTAHMNESLRKCGWVMAQMWMSHVAYLNESCRTYECIVYGEPTLSRLLKIIGLFCKRALKKRLYSAKETCNFKEPIHRSHPITHTYESISFYVCITSHIRISHVTRRHVSSRTYEQVMLHVWMSADTQLNMSRHTHWVATVSRIDKIKVLFCRISSLL